MRATPTRGCTGERAAGPGTRRVAAGINPAARGRAGVTLIEVLVSIFVVALGLLALLTLFPLGALSMAQAIRDDRVAQTAANAVATIKVMNVLSDQTITNALSFNPPPPNNIPVSGPGFAVYFDPIGYKNYPAP